MSFKYIILPALIYLLATGYSDSRAGGISADAGLTPAQDKWILRTQMRFMQRSNDPMPMNREMEMYMFPMVVAYGLRPELTVMVRQPYARMDMTMNSATNRETGFGDLMVMAKYRALRYNSRRYTFGIAPLLGFILPTGQKPFAADGLGLKTGFFFSGRIVPWAGDLNVTYRWNGVTGGDDVVRNEELEIIAALAHQINFGESARTALAPVLELSYNNLTQDRISGIKQPNTGESWLGVSPGLKVTYSSLIFEGLVRIPVWRNQIGLQPELGTGVLFGIRVFL